MKKPLTIGNQFVRGLFVVGPAGLPDEFSFHSNYRDKLLAQLGFLTNSHFIRIIGINFSPSWVRTSYPLIMSQVLLRCLAMSLPVIISFSIESEPKNDKECENKLIGKS